MTTAPKIWTPSRPQASKMNSFMNFINKKYSLNFQTYEELRKWSISKISDFWACVWEFCGIKASSKYLRVVDETLVINEIPKWFEGARLNYAENLMQRDDDGIAIIGTGENTDNDIKITFKQLRSKVGRLIAAFRDYGIKPGDRIAGMIPNSPESVICMLAAAAVGAIWSSASPDFGPKGVLDRFTQITPRILITVESVMYNGKVHDNIAKVVEVAEGLNSLEVLIFIPHLVEPSAYSSIQLSNPQKKCTSMGEFISNVREQDPIFEQVPFDHPLVILYSSGTTGIPKCIVHSQGGTLIQHKKEHMIHGSMNEHDIFFYYSTTGWMMWNWLISGLACGATIVCYDGNPFKPTVKRLWQMVEDYRISIFGTSAKYIQSLEDMDFHPGKEVDLSSMHSLYSTGSALKPHSFDFIYNSIKKDVLVGSITGGTDIVSLFAGHCTSLPVYRGEIQCRCLGMAVEAWNDSGVSVMDEPGDLVCTKPFPVMPVGFWNDADGSRYQSAYFTQIPGVWYHGDFMVINSQTGGVVMQGRSDGTLNPAGVRFGSAELYNIMNIFPEVQDSLVVGQKIDDGEQVVMFLKMANGHKFTSELVARIKAKVREQLSPRHVPAVILPIGDIPYTLTGKKVEVAVKKIISGENIKASSSLANPESLDLYYAIRSKL